MRHAIRGSRIKGSVRRTCRHRVTGLLCTAFCDDTVEFIKIGVEVEY